MAVSLASIPDLLRKPRVPRAPRTPEVRPVVSRPARQPLPRSLAGRLTVLSATCRRLPLLPLGLLWVLFLGIGLSYYIGNAPYFEIGSIDLQGTGRLDRERVLARLEERTGASLGASLIQLDEDAVMEALLAIPEVREATVEKVWPNELHLWVIEREAAGILVTERGSFVYDGNGYLFSPATGADFQKRDFAILSGFRGTAPEPGRALPPEAFRLACSYASTFSAASPLLATAVSEWHWDDAEGLTVVMDNGARMRCGRRPPEETGPVIEALVAMQTPARRLESATLVTSDHVAVRWAYDKVPTTVSHAADKKH